MGKKRNFISSDVNKITLCICTSNVHCFGKNRLFPRHIVFIPYLCLMDLLLYRFITSKSAIKEQKSHLACQPDNLSQNINIKTIRVL